MQCSRVYATVGRSEPALQLCQANDIGDFQLAYAYEALARARALAGEAVEARRWTGPALLAAEAIAEESDRELVLSDLETVPGRPRFW